MDDVEQRFVDLADVVEERDALDRSWQSCSSSAGRLGEDQGVGGDAADVRAGSASLASMALSKRLERGGGEAFGDAAAPSFARERAAPAGEAGARRREVGLRDVHAR